MRSQCGAMESPARRRFLYDLLRDSARRRPDQVALEDPFAGHLSYADLDELSDRLATRLVRLGIAPGDRVGICLRKSLDAVTAVFGILKAGAVYVPVDATAPAARDAFIFANCSVKAVFVENELAAGLTSELAMLRAAPTTVSLDYRSSTFPLRAWLEADVAPTVAPPKLERVPLSSDDSLAYILYTSGSTGKPKGVMLSHRNAVSFVDWCSEVFQPDDEQRFSSHAPFHFDLSILDIYVPIKHGATLVLIGEQLGKDPSKLAALIAQRKISMWYSTPSILSLLSQFGHLDRQDLSALRMVLFAGEVFPVKHLRAVHRLLPGRRFFNLYGPTETNVCTYYEIPAEIPDDRTEPYPIGTVCSHSQSKVIDTDGRDVRPGEEGELCIAGDGVMLGYWNSPDANARVFFNTHDGRRWYKTGDIVIEHAGGVYQFIGRRDRMVKKRGYRIELGEIEAGLYRHPAIKEAAVVALPDEESGVRIKAFLSCRESRPSIIELKQFCADHLPAYMVPDLFSWQPALPKTSTDKIDYQRLKELD